MKRLLDQVKPDWHWEPTLIEVDPVNTRVFTGLAMRGRLLIKLGPRRAWYIAQITAQVVASTGAPNIDRRRFLQYGSAALLALAFWPRLKTSQAVNSSTVDILDTTPVTSEERRILIEKAINSAELQEILANGTFAFNV
jgi:hypothetical protein